MNEKNGFSGKKESKRGKQVRWVLYRSGVAGNRGCVQTDLRGKRSREHSF